MNAPKVQNWIRFLADFIEASIVQDQPVQTVQLPGKQGQLLAHISQDSGASISALCEALGWLPHTTRAAVSRLRRAGITVNTTRRNGQTVYKAAGGSTGTTADSLFRGIPTQVETFYKNRAAVLAA